MNKDHKNIVIIGSGPAGLTAAIYLARANLKPHIVAGQKWGGQLMLTTKVENYSGFPEGIQGPELMQKMRAQAEHFGATLDLSDVVKVDFSKRPLKIMTAEQEIETESVIIATGASAKWLGLESEKRFIGKGVSSCATCDGVFFKDRKVVVVGGGDVALEEALFLTKFATEVVVVHRRDSLRASQIMQERAKKNQKIGFVWDTVVTEVLGQEQVEGVRLKNLKTDKEEEIKTDGIFVAIGHKPNTDFLKGQIKLDKKGYVVVEDNTRTSVKGVFAAGDVQDYRYRQAISAAGLGCMASLDAENWLAENNK